MLRTKSLCMCACICTWICAHPRKRLSILESGGPPKGDVVLTLRLFLDPPLFFHHADAHSTHVRRPVNYWRDPNPNTTGFLLNGPQTLPVKDIGPFDGGCAFTQLYIEAAAPSPFNPIAP